MKKIIILILGILPLLIVLLFYTKLPEEIPVHYGFSGEVDRFGSKNELFLMLLIPLLILVVLWIVAKRGWENEHNLNITYNIIIWALCFFDFCLSLIIYCGINGITNLSEIRGEQLLLLGVSFLLILIGNTLPKVRKSKLIGFRVPWVYKNEEVWRRTQRLTGYLVFFSGIITLFLTLLTPPLFALSILLISVLLSVTFTLLYSYRLAKNS